jgi:hypothetical protein
MDSIEELEHAIDGAALLGMELETRYRVLAVTLEPDAPIVADHQADRRVQLLCSPVSTILGSLRLDRDGQVEVYTFHEHQLIDVVATFHEPPVRSPVFDLPEPRPGSWAPRWSLEGRSHAPDGTRHTLTVCVEEPDRGGIRSLDVFARFDEIQVRDPNGVELTTIR